MEKASKILVFIFFLGLAYLAWSVLIYSPQKELEARSVDLKMAVHGESMLPTLNEDDIVHYSRSNPSIGEIVIFTCKTDRCHSFNNELFIKRLSEVKGGCYTFLGDNPDHSFDSRSFGPLCGDEVNIEGVVTSVDFSK